MAGAADLPVGEIAVQQPLTIPTRCGEIAGLLLDPRAERKSSPVVVWYHGGGFVTGDLETHRAFAAEAARRLDLPVTSRRYPSQDEFATGRILTEAAREWYYGHYRADVHDWHGSPLLGDLTGLPPAVVLTAGEDPVRDEGRAYAAALITAGVPTTFLEAAGHVHAFVLLRRVVPSTQDDLARAFAALSATVRAGAEAAPTGV
jgi:acetyl esterase/lipase